MPKYVVSTSLEEPKWVNATVLTGDVPAQVAKLKQGSSGDILDATPATTSAAP